MPTSGSYTLADVTIPKIEIVCDVCRRRGVYSTQRMLERFGPDIVLPELKTRLVSEGGCRDQSAHSLQGCKAKFSYDTVKSWLSEEGLAWLNKSKSETP